MNIKNDLPLQFTAREKQTLRFYEAKKNILTSLMEDEIEYILDLKNIDLLIRPSFNKQNLINQQESGYMFGEIQIMINHHQQFMLALNSQLQETQFKLKKFQITKILMDFIQYLQIYNQYLSRVPKIMQKLEKIQLQCPDLFVFLEKSYQLKFQIQDYFSLPMRKILSYKTVINNFINTCSEYGKDSEHAKFQQIYEKYLVNLSKIQQYTPLSEKQANKVIQSVLLHQFESLLAGQEFQILGKFEGSSIQFQNCKVYIVLKKHFDEFHKQVPFDVLYIFFMSKAETLNKEQRLGHIQLSQNSFIEARPNGFYYRNKILICGKNKSSTIFMKNNSDKKFLSTLLEIPLARSRFVSDDIYYTPYEANIYRFYLVFLVVGVLNRTQKQADFVYAIKLKLCAFSHYSQMLFLKWKQILEIIDYMKMVYQIKFQGYEANNILGTKQKTEIQQIRCIKIQQILNSLVRRSEIRKHPEYLFNKLKVSESVWILAKAENSSRLQCNKQSLENLSVQQLYQIVNFFREVPKKCFPKSDIFENNDQYSTISPFLWIVAAESLYLQLYKKNQFSPTKSKSRKTVLWHQSHISDKILYTIASFKEINDRMNPKIRFLKKAVPIKIMIFSREKQIQEKLVYHTSYQDTVETILQELGWVLKLDKLTEFSLFGKCDNRTFFIDRSEKIQNLLTLKFDILYLHKTIKLSPCAQKQMFTNLKESSKKIDMIVGQFIQLVSKQACTLNEQETIDYLSYLIVFREEKETFTNFCDKYLPHNLSIEIKNIQTQVTKKSEDLKKKSLTQKYNELYNIFINKESWSSEIFYCKIWAEDKRVSLSTTKQADYISHYIRKYYSLQQYEIIINYQKIILRPRNRFSKSSQNFKVQQKDNNIPQFLWHDEYLIEACGEVVTIKIKTSTMSHEIYILCNNSLFLWRLAMIYQGMFDRLEIEKN